MKGQSQGHPDFRSRTPRVQSLIARKGAELGHKLLLILNRKPYIMSPITPSPLTLSDLQRSKSRSPRFRKLISRKGGYLGSMFLLNINTKPYMGSPNDTIAFLSLSDLERSKSRSPI